VLTPLKSTYMRTFLVIATFLSVATTTQAEWQYTRWGMTRDQVVAASKGAAVPTTPQEQQDHKLSPSGVSATLKQPWAAGRFKFDAFFYFGEEGGLSMVDLQLRSGNPHELIGALRKKYGEPESKSSSARLTILLWRTDADQISLMLIGGLTPEVEALCNKFAALGKPEKAQECRQKMSDSKTSLAYQPRKTKEAGGL
jgi:hypothetical protein